MILALSYSKCKLLPTTRKKYPDSEIELPRYQIPAEDIKGR